MKTRLCNSLVKGEQVAFYWFGKNARGFGEVISVNDKITKVKLLHKILEIDNKNLIGVLDNNGDYFDLVIE